MDTTSISFIHFVTAPPREEFESSTVIKAFKNSGVCLRNTCYPYNVESDIPECLGIAGIGQLYIKNATMNDSLNSAILSGTFGFTFNDSVSGINEVSFGRFDYRFGKNSNFQMK